jgi:hypothetical protein
MYVCVRAVERLVALEDHEESVVEVQHAGRLLDDVENIGEEPRYIGPAGLDLAFLVPAPYTVEHSSQVRGTRLALSRAATKHRYVLRNENVEQHAFMTLCLEPLDQGARTSAARGS